MSLDGTYLLTEAMTRRDEAVRQRDVLRFQLDKATAEHALEMSEAREARNVAERQLAELRAQLKYVVEHCADNADMDSDPDSRAFGYGKACRTILSGIAARKGTNNE